MGLFTNPLSHAGYPPGVTGTPFTQPSEVRAATVAEAVAATLNNVYISPLTAASIGSGANFASPSPIGSTTPNSGAFTTLTSSGATTLATGAGVAAKLGNATGTLGFFGATGGTKQTQGAITNSVTAGGSTGTIADFTDLTTYATDAPTIRDDIYQLALGLQGCIAALRTYGLLA